MAGADDSSNAQEVAGIPFYILSAEQYYLKLTQGIFSELKICRISSWVM